MDYRHKTKPTKQKKQPKSCPNPLFLKWLEQWRDEAKSKESKLQYVYSKAVTSLKKYPLPLESGKEAILLEGIGPNIAKKLDEELAKHRSNLVYNATAEGPSVLKERKDSVDNYNLSDLRVPPPCSAMPIVSTSSSCSGLEDVAEPKSKKKRKSSPREYIPIYRSGPYAIIITLFKASERSGYKGYMTKSEILLQAQPLSDTSFIVAEPDSHYTAWSSMSTLIKKGLIVKSGSPARYHLTDSGHVLAEKLLTATSTTASADDSNDEICMRPLFQRITTTANREEKEITSQTLCKKATPEILPSFSDQPSTKEGPQYELRPGSFEIILCVDFVEITAGTKTARKDEMVKELRLNGVQFDVRKLNVGDFLWIAQEKMTPIPGQLVLPTQRELVLDHIVERKRMDDLCSSIKDGRFKEQKFRLLNSGLRHPVYLVEDFGSANFLSMPAQTLEQSIINTQIGQEFFVKRTRDIKESAAYLTLMTRYLQTEYNSKTLKAIKRNDVELVNVDENQLSTFLMTFQELNDISLKNRILTVGELFGKQLLQIPGVAVEKVVTIMESYLTLRHLLDAYEEQTSEKEKEGLLSELKFGKNQRKIGPSISKLIYQLYCTKGALS